MTNQPDGGEQQWQKVDAKDRMAPWNWQIRQYVGTLEDRCVADHLTEANADRIIADHAAALRAEMMAAGLRAANFNFEQEHKARKQAEARATSANTRVLQLQVQLAEAVRERDEAREAREQDKESMLYHYHLWLETDEKLLAAQAALAEAGVVPPQDAQEGG